MKIINLSKDQLFASGSHGLYFRLSQREGVKIIKKSGCKNIPSLTSEKSQRVFQEATIGLLANGPTKKVVLAFFEGRYYFGILQRHVIEVKSPSKINLLSVKRSLSKKKVVHGDLHPKNIIQTSKGSVLIDYDPDYAHFVGDKKVYYTVKNKLIKDLKSLTL